MEKALRQGDTLLFPAPPVLVAHAAVGGKKESEGPLAGADAVTAGTLTSCTLIALSALLTALGWYQKLALRAGAGSLVPITGFANAVVSAAIEFRPEGCVTGTGAKMFTIAGPVIVYGTLASAVYGLALWVSTLL